MSTGSLFGSRRRRKIHNKFTAYFQFLGVKKLKSDEIHAILKLQLGKEL